MFCYEASGRDDVRVAPNIALSNEEHSELTQLVRSKLTSVRLVQRARIVLLAAEGNRERASGGTPTADRNAAGSPTAAASPARRHAMPRHRADRARRAQIGFFKLLL